MELKVVHTQFSRPVDKVALLILNGIESLLIQILVVAQFSVLILNGIESSLRI